VRPSPAQNDTNHPESDRGGKERSWPKCSCYYGLQLVIRFICGNNLVERSLRGHFRTFTTPTVRVYTEARTIRLAYTVGRQLAKALENSCTPPGEIDPKSDQRLLNG